MRDEPSLYAWFLHDHLLDALFASDGHLGSFRTRLGRRIRGDQDAYTDRLERWLRTHEVPPLETKVLDGTCRAGDTIWTELDFHWSDVAHERRALRDGQNDVRSSFHAVAWITDDEQRYVHGTFNPARLTCSTSNSELRGVRRQYMLGQVAAADQLRVELRPLAIATRLLPPPPRQWDGDWQRIAPRQVAQFAAADWDLDVRLSDLEELRDVSEAELKRMLADLLGEQVVPKDWGGEQCDLWTSRLMVDGRPHTAAFLLKGPAFWRPMTIKALGKNGDQLNRIADTEAEVLVVQHCNVIRPEVYSMLQRLASDYRRIRRYMVIDGFDTLRLIRFSRRTD